MKKQSVKSRKNDRLHTHSTCRCFYALNFRQHRDISESSPRRYITHILSHNHQLPMRICEEIQGEKSQKSTFINTKSTFRCFHALNLRQPAANIEICWTEVHTDTPHAFSLTTTTFQCVFVKKWEVTRRKNAWLYTHGRLFDAWMLSTSSHCLQI